MDTYRVLLTDLYDLKHAIHRGDRADALRPRVEDLAVRVHAAYVAQGSPLGPLTRQQLRHIHALEDTLCVLTGRGREPGFDGDEDAAVNE